MVLSILAVLGTACLFGYFLAILVGSPTHRPTAPPEGDP
jgi:hypothetical protein